MARDETRERVKEVRRDKQGVELPPVGLAGPGLPLSADGSFDKPRPLQACILLRVTMVSEHVMDSLAY